jgi:hypothetical protein
MLWLAVWLKDEKTRYDHYLDNVDKIGDYIETHEPSTAPRIAMDLSIPEQEVIDIGDVWGEWSQRASSGERYLLSIESTEKVRQEMQEAEL